SLAAMNIRQAADGILGTHVKWEEFEHNLRKALKTESRFGPNKSAVDIGEGIGYASRCALVSCHWQGEGSELLPKRVVLKMGSCMAIANLVALLPDHQNPYLNGPAELWERMENNIRDMHNIECDMYDFMELFEGDHTVPRRYYAKAFTDENLLAGQICMEYMEDSQMLNFHERVSLVQMKQIARALGRLQADSTKHEVTSESIKTKDIFAEFTKSKPKEQYMVAFGPLKMMEASLAEPIEKVEQLMSEYYDATVPSSIHKQLGLKPVLVNGDMRTENVLVDKDTGDLRALIDWQCCHLGVGVEDLLRISFFAQTTDDRRASAPMLIEEMYEAFVDNLNGSPAPFSLQQLKDAYDLLFPHCALFFATGLSLLMKPASGISDEEKQRRHEVMLDKARGVIEDMVAYHEKNRDGKHKIVWNYAAA
ncbi:hypothetical protein PMAYCL1PPCAC_32043, partial [Pristionchus mayeri]